MDCEFCNHSFSSKGILISHQKSAKYCLKLQNKNNENFICNFCNKIFTSQYNLNEHFNTCKEKQHEEMETRLKDGFIKEIEYLKEKLKEMETTYTRQLDEKDRHYHQKIEEKETTIAKLEAKLEKFENAVIANTRNPITTNNNTIVLNNTLNLNDTEKFKSIIGEGLNKNVVCNGQKGLAKFVFDNILKGPDGKLMYKCVDPSRQNFEFTNSDGIVEKDVKAIKLKRALIEGDVIVKAQKSGEELWTKEDGSMDTDRYAASSGKVLEIMTVDRDDTKFRSELSALTS
jgi:hypothetical protein